MFPHLFQEKFLSSMSLVLDWLQKWLQLLTPSYVYIICNKTSQHLPLRDVPVPWMRGSCDLLWLRTWGRRDGMPVPNLGFRQPCVSTFFRPPLCDQGQASLLYDEKHITLTPSWQPANCQHGSEAIQDQSASSLPPDCWLMSKPSRDQTVLGHFNRTSQRICWLVSGTKSLLS